MSAKTVITGMYLFFFILFKFKFSPIVTSPKFKLGRLIFAQQLAI